MIEKNNSQYERRLLAQSLMRHYQIKHGDSLVHLLGEGNERSNQDAIEGWVARTLASYSFSAEADVFGELVHAFATELADAFPAEVDQLADITVSFRVDAAETKAPIGRPERSGQVIPLFPGR